MDPIDLPVIGISACLLGDKVRYDGRGSRHAWLVDTLGPTVRYVSVCPEVEAGLGVPREPIHLERRADEVRVCRVETHDDLTEELKAWALARLQGFDEIDGYVLKSKSPSCGRKAVPVHSHDGKEIDEHAGFFALAVRGKWPGIQIVEEKDLDDEASRRSFLRGVGRHYQVRTGRDMGLLGGKAT